MANIDDCQHARIASEGMDQTIGVYCRDCNVALAYCWMDHHVPESLWNRLCAQPDRLPDDADCIPCEQNRDDVCAFCHEPIPSVAP